MAAMRMKLAAILAAPLVTGVSDLLASPGKTERLLRRRFIAATVDGTWDTPVLTEHPAETAAIAAPVVWRALAGGADRPPGLVNQVFTGKDRCGTQLQGAVAWEGTTDANKPGRSTVLAVPDRRA